MKAPKIQSVFERKMPLYSIVKSFNKKKSLRLFKTKSLSHDQVNFLVNFLISDQQRLHPKKATDPIRLEKSFLFFGKLFYKEALKIPKQLTVSLKKRQTFRKLIQFHKKAIWQREKRYFLRQEKIKNSQLRIFVQKDKQMLEKFLKYSCIKLLRLRKYFQELKINLIYIDCFLVFEYLTLPKYNFPVWDNFMLKRLKIRRAHQNQWESVFYICKRFWNWQIFSLIHTQILAPSLLTWCYKYFVYFLLLPSLAKALYNYFSTMSLFSDVVVFINRYSNQNYIYIALFLFLWAFSYYLQVNGNVFKQIRLKKQEEKREDAKSN